MKSSIFTLIIVATLFGWFSLVLSYFTINGVIYLLNASENWGELGFLSTSLLIVLLLSGGYAVAVLSIFIPLEYFKHRKGSARRLWMEAIIGGAVWGVVVPIISLLIAEQVMGGTRPDFVNEIKGLLTFKGITWVISSMFSGAIMFGWAAHASQKSNNLCERLESLHQI